MSRLTTKRKAKNEEEPEDEVITKWSIPKVLIAIGILALVGMAGVYAYDNFRSKNEQVITTRAEDKAQIQIPSERKIEEIVNDAKKSLSGVDAKNLVDSQPQIKEAIENLQKLTTNDTDAKKMVCNAVCK